MTLEIKYMLKKKVTFTELKFKGNRDPNIALKSVYRPLMAKCSKSVGIT